MYISNQDPDQLCFTRALQLKNQLQSSRNKDKITLNLEPLSILATSRDKLVSGNGFLRIYIHAHGQLRRNFDKPKYEISFKSLNKNVHTKAFLSLEYLSVLKKRPDANEKCNSSLEDEDNNFEIRLIEEVGCIPNYVKSFVLGKVPHDVCNSAHAINSANRFIQNFSTLISDPNYNPPCKEMMVSVNTQQNTTKSQKDGKTTTFSFVVSYATGTFQEIQNEKDYTFETLFSNAGGFIGIFLGTSLLQIPEIFSTDWNKKWKKIKQLFN